MVGFVPLKYILTEYAVNVHDGKDTRHMDFPVFGGDVASIRTFPALDFGNVLLEGDPALFKGRQSQAVSVYMPNMRRVRPIGQGVLRKAQDARMLHLVGHCYQKASGVGSAEINASGRHHLQDGLAIHREQGDILFPFIPLLVHAQDLVYRGKQLVA